MKLSQEVLCAGVASRVRSARPELALRHDLTGVDGLLALQAELGAGGDEVTATVVVRSFELEPFIRGACAFARLLEPARAAAWRRSFTRTVFLAGNPDNLRERFAFAHLAGGASAGWISPAPASELTGLRRLLKRFDGPDELRIRGPIAVDLPELGARDRAAARWELHLAVHGVSLSSALVHLHHLLAEAVLDGTIAGGDRLAVRTVPRLTDAARFAALRVDVDQSDAKRLRAYAGLTEEK